MRRDAPAAARVIAASAPAVRERVAKALVNKGFVLGELGRSQDAVHVFEEVVRRFGQYPNAAVRLAAEHAGRGLDDLQRLLTDIANALR